MNFSYTKIGIPMVTYLDKTIKITETTKNRLDKIKVHPREPYDEVITRLLNFMDQQPLTSFDKKKGNF